MPFFAKPEKRAAADVAICPRRLWRPKLKQQAEAKYRIDLNYFALAGGLTIYTKKYRLGGLGVGCCRSRFGVESAGAKASR
jgi:hypothetical protein